MLEPSSSNLRLVLSSRSRSLPPELAEADSLVLALADADVLGETDGLALVLVLGEAETLTDADALDERLALVEPGPKSSSLTRNLQMFIAVHRRCLILRCPPDYPSRSFG